jgi:hypothetical protein
VPVPATSASAWAAGVIARALTQAQLTASDVHQAADATEGFEAVVDRIDHRIDQLSHRVASLTEAVRALAVQTRTAPAEPSFEPAARGIDLIVAGTPGFQALMDIRHALARLPQTQSASVLRYERDEAEFHLVLSQAMTAAAIADAVGATGGRRPLIEAAAPDARRLRLRLTAV